MNDDVICSYCKRKIWPKKKPGINAYTSKQKMVNIGVYVPEQWAQIIQDEAVESDRYVAEVCREAMRPWIEPRLG